MFTNFRQDWNHPRRLRPWLLSDSHEPFLHKDVLCQPPAELHLFAGVLCEPPAELLLLDPPDPARSWVLEVDCHSWIYLCSGVIVQVWFYEIGSIITWCSNIFMIIIIICDLYDHYHLWTLWAFLSFAIFIINICIWNFRIIIIYDFYDHYCHLWYLWSSSKILLIIIMFYNYHYHL